MNNIVIIPEDKIKVLTSCDRFPANGYFTFYKEDAEVEQVPTNWEELKNLCNENNLEILADIIYTNALSFHKNGDIKDNENSMVAVNRTPQQMWDIIKALVGAE